MNYRHAYHAGNAADCLKHALLVALLRALLRKPTAFTVLDTHAGIGTYDLSGPEAQATGEHRCGIARLRENPPVPLVDYLAQIADPETYPGSPAIVRGLLRADDRLICCELHPEDAAVLRARFSGDPRVAVHHRCGFAALRGLLPPATARGLVLIDPPYERANDYEAVVAGLRTASTRFGTGIIAAWYPIKHMAPVRALHHAVAGCLRDVIAASLTLRPATDPRRLNGSGLLVVNPPFGFEAEARSILGALCERLGEAGPGFRVERIADE